MLQHQQGEGLSRAKQDAVTDRSIINMNKHEVTTRGRVSCATVVQLKDKGVLLKKKKKEDHSRMLS